MPSFTLQATGNSGCEATRCRLDTLANSPPPLTWPPNWPMTTTNLIKRWMKLSCRRERVGADNIPGDQLRKRILLKLSPARACEIPIRCRITQFYDAELIPQPKMHEMNKSTVAATGQTTVSAGIRKIIGSVSGTRLVWHVLANGRLFVRAKNKSVFDLVGMPAPPNGKYVSIEKMRRCARAKMNALKMHIDPAF